MTRITNSPDDFGVTIDSARNEYKRGYLDGLKDGIRAGGKYRFVFFMTYGPFPHPCYFCGEKVDGYGRPLDRGSAIIHHIDGNKKNNDPTNLAPAHHGCHLSWHGRNISSETRAKRSRASKRQIHSPERRSKASASMTELWATSEDYRTKVSTGRQGPFSDSHRTNISTAAKARWNDPDYREAETIKLRAMAKKNKGKTVDAKTRAKISAGNKGKRRTLNPCHYCSRMIGGSGNLVQHELACRLRVRPQDG